MNSSQHAPVSAFQVCIQVCLMMNKFNDIYVIHCSTLNSNKLIIFHVFMLVIGNTMIFGRSNTLSLSENDNSTSVTSHKYIKVLSSLKLV